MLCSKQVDRTGTSRTVVPVLVKKDTNWQDKIVDMCVASLETGSVPAPMYPVEVVPSKRAAEFSKVIYLLLQFGLKFCI